MICKSSKYGIVEASNCQRGTLSIAILVEDTTVPTVPCSAVTGLPEFVLETNGGQPALQAIFVSWDVPDDIRSKILDRNKRDLLLLN